MGFAIYFHGAADGDDGPFDLASIGAWTKFREWVETLATTDFPALRRLCEDGEVTGTDALSADLARALASCRPEGAAFAVAGELAEVMGVGDPDETATITD